ncbi:MAG: STAS-like domain-containing protein [Deltaproteobacteria bacterium]|nr:STAS-like domain-containing protein [Deltaproteobacteria bacterium]
MDFKMKDFGAILESRDLAKSLCQSIIDEHWKKPTEHMRLDFGGVRVVSNFFAEAFIGGLIEGMGTEPFKQTFTLLNLSDMNRIWVDRAIEKHKSAPAAVEPPPPPPPPPPKPAEPPPPPPPPTPAPAPASKPAEPPPPKAAPVEAPPLPAPPPPPTTKPVKTKEKAKPKPAAKKAPAKKPAAKGKKK